MNFTKHMTQRMQQRCIPMAMVEVVLADGHHVSDEKICINQKEIKNKISELDFEILALKRKKQAFEKIYKRGITTVISKDKKLITTYTSN